jgi:magnesium transporter
MSELGVIDYAKQITYHPRERVKVLRSRGVGEQSVILQSVSPYIQQQLLRLLTNREIVDILDHMDLQTAQQVVMRIKDVRRRTKIVSSLKGDIKDKVEYFLRFHPKATFSLVHFNYVFISVELTIGEAGDIIERHYNDTGKFPEILVHRDGELLGEILLGTLVREGDGMPLTSFVQPLTTINYQAEVGEVVEVLTSSGKKKVVVLDNDGSVLGVIYADDALELIGHDAGDSLYSFVGVGVSELPFDSGWQKFSHRYHWLVLNLATAFLAGSVILLFQSTIDRLAILAVYIPIVTGMGGNAASQTFAVVVRGITMGSISLKNSAPAIWSELQAGVLHGVLIGLIVALISIVFHGSAMLGIVVASAMITVHIVAGLAGAIIPLVLKYYGKDPAAVSMIFISTCTDVFGMLSLLGLGALLLS